MPRLASRFRRLDNILADLPIDDDPMLLTELDGYLTGVVVCPELIKPSEWLPPIWGGSYGEGAPFEDPRDVQLFADMVTARYNEIVRDLGRNKVQPIFDIDERNGDSLWELWADGFRSAMALRPGSWLKLAEGDDRDAAAALDRMVALVQVATNESSLTSMEINTICDEAPRLIPAYVAQLHAWRLRHTDPQLGLNERPAKVGRNEPCPCGSGKKHKRCCGASWPEETSGRVSRHSHDEHSARLESGLVGLQNCAKSKFVRLT
jgi:uncharacterized protein